MKYVIGVDAGGTHTTCVAYRTDGSPLGRWRSGSGNPASAGLEAAGRAIEEAIEQCREQLGSDAALAVVGAAGAETGNNKQMLQERFNARYPFLVQVISDAQLVLEARLDDQDGIVVIAGTGSVAWGRKGERMHRCGGWGHLIGDQGSGYAISMQAIRGMAEQVDNGRPLDALGLAIMRQLQAESWRDVVDFVYRSEKAGIASLLPLIETFALAGDPRAVRLVDEAADQLAALASRCLSVLGLNQPLIAASGSVLQKMPQVQQRFQALLSSSFPGCRIDFAQIEANRAAVNLFRRISE